MSDSKKESWSSGNLYHAYMGRWSELIAQEFLVWLNPDDGLKWLDVGCGTGALTRTIVNHTPVKSIVELDPSQDFLDEARQSIDASNVQFKQGSGTDLKFEDSQFDRAVSALALNFMPNPQQAVTEMARVTKSNGVVALYVWDYAGKMEWLKYFWDVAVSLDADANAYDEGQRFPICHPDRLSELFAKAGLNQVETHAIDVPAKFATFEEYWQLFQIGSFPAPAYLKALSQDKQSQLKNKLRKTIPTQSDGTIDLVTRAWAIRGTKS
jgi:ubiquinone/menaquinone biosynthesis C-methylase UbiE